MPLGIDDQSRDGISRKEEQDRIPAQSSDSKPGEVEKNSEIDVEMGASTTSCQPTSVPASRLHRHVMWQIPVLLSCSGLMFAEDVPMVEKSAESSESRIESGEAKERCHPLLSRISRVDQCQIQKLFFLYEEKDEGPTLDLIVQKLEAIRQAASDAPKQHPAWL